MIKELWNSFPRILEQKINALLDEAEPSSTKAFQLYKTCQREQAYSGTFEKFAEHLEQYFSIAKADRRKSDIDQLLDRPLHSSVYLEFHLNFRTAQVNALSVSNIVSWAHNLLRLNYRTNSPVISSDVISKTLQYIINPPLFEKAQDINFSDFCEAWKKTVFKLFGKQYDGEFTKIMNELKWLDRQSAEIAEANSSNHEPFIPTIYLTQTEIDWTESVHRAVFFHQPVPKFPLTKGPQKQRLIDLQRAISLYKIVQSSKLPEFVKHRENIRTTILSRCECLLKERAR